MITNSIDETFKLGEDLAKKLRGGEVILLNGDLGAGKTVFAKGLAKGLGVQAVVNSPTFNIMNVYQGQNIKFCHFDMYRIDDDSELKELGFEEFIGDNNYVCVIEWPSKTASLLPKSVITVNINKLDDDKRNIEIEGV